MSLSFELQLTETELNDYKVLKKATQDNLSKEDNNSVKNLVDIYFEKTDSNIFKKYKKRKDGVGNYLNSDKIISFLNILNFHISQKIKKERERAWKYLNNKKEAEKYGFVDENEYKELGKKIPKQSNQQIEQWAEKAYPKLELDKWEFEFISSLMKHLN